MIDRPTILRARICRELAGRHPKGMTAGQVNQYLAWSSKSDEVRATLRAMVADGLLVERAERRPPPREPLHVFVAAEALLGMGGDS